MRIRNLAVFISVAFAAVVLYTMIDFLGQALGMPGVAGVSGSLGSVFVKFFAPRILIAYFVLYVSGGVLARFLHSAVPLKWCLALGSLYGMGYLLLTLAIQNASIDVILVVALSCVGLFLAPILGGWRAKRSARPRRR